MQSADSQTDKAQQARDEETVDVSISDSVDSSCGNASLVGTFQGFQKALYFFVPGGGLGPSGSSDTDPYGERPGLGSRRLSLESIAKELSFSSALSYIGILEKQSTIKSTGSNIDSPWRLKFEGIWARVDEKDLTKALEFQLVGSIRASNAVARVNPVSIQFPDSGNPMKSCEFGIVKGTTAPLVLQFGIESAPTKVRHRMVYDTIWWDDETKSLQHKREDPTNGESDEGGMTIKTSRCLLDDDTMLTKTVVVSNGTNTSMTTEITYKRVPTGSSV